MSFIWWGRFSYDLLLIGAVDGFVVALIVSSIVIYFVKKLRENERLAGEAIQAATVRAEIEKIKSETILAAIGDGISIQDTDFKVLYQNQIHKDLAGDHIREHCFKAYGRKDHVCEGCPLAESFKDGRIHKLEKSRSENNKQIYVEIIASPLFDTSGKIIAGIEVVRNITERKQAEEELRRYHQHLEDLVKERTADLTMANEFLHMEVAERRRIEEEIKSFSQKLEAIINSSSDFILLKDKDFRYLVVNEECGKFFNLPVKDIIGKTDFDFMQKEAAEACRRGDEEALKSDGPIHTEECVKDRWLHVVKQRVVDSEGNLIGIAAVIRDITDRKKMEEELLKAQKLESLGILAGGIAHDFNNALTGILGNISLARMFVNPEDKISRRLAAAEKATLSAQNLTQQLLTFSMGGAPVKRITSIAVLLEESTAFALRGSNVRCECSIDKDLWPVEADEGQISQVISNLIINAQQAMPEGGIIKVIAENITIDAGNPFLLESGKYLKISIEDQGIGIPEEHLTKIFDPYFTTKQKGSGLGLATTYSIIKNHSGHIAVESKLSVGTTFYIYLPASKEQTLIKKEVEETPVAGSGKILVMDDETDIRESISEALTLLGYEICLAGDGAKAIELYKKARESGNPFSAVIMDLTISGGMGGKEAIKNLIEIDPEVKAIVSSGYSNDPVMSDFMKYGFRDVITKPYKIKDLSRVLHRVITG